VTRDITITITIIITYHYIKNWTHFNFSLDWYREEMGLQSADVNACIDVIGIDNISYKCGVIFSYVTFFPEIHALYFTVKR
jgi:hypothetical protein